MRSSLFIAVALAAAAKAHTAAWANGMYCKGGNVTGVDDSNTDSAVNPLYQMAQEDWFFQHYQGCDLVPPPEGEFLELPAGGTFTVELAHNRGQTTLSFGGQFTSEWPDGQQHPENWSGNATDGEGCIQNDGAMHVQNQTMATGTAFAISYQSDISAVTMENLAVFTVLEHTPWKRISTYSVPAAMPACPSGGCTCAWLWIPNGCGIQNMYMQGYKCNVTGATSTAPVAPAQPPVYCGTDVSTCVPDAKQILAWHQATGNNVFPPNGVSPGYNIGMGWAPGAQDDIFVSAPLYSSTSSSSIAASTSSSSSSSSISSPSGPPPSATTNVKVVSTNASSLSLSSSYTAPASKPISTLTSTILSPSIAPITSSSTSHQTTLITSTIPAAPATTAPITSESITPSASYSASSTSSAPPTSTSDMFPDFVKWMESAWAEWVASHGGQA